MVSIECHRLLDVIEQISAVVTYEDGIEGTYLEHAIFDRNLASWNIAFRQIPIKKGRYHPPLQFTYALEEIVPDQAENYNPLVYLFGLDEALAISQNYMAKQVRFTHAELYLANRLSVNQAQWEINYLVCNQAQDAFYVDLQVDVPSGMIFDVNIARAAQAYDVS